MKDLKQFNIPFVGLSEGNHDFKYIIENEFFEYFNFDEFESASHSGESAVNKLWPINLVMRLSIFPFFRFDLVSNNRCLRRA